MTYYRWLEQEAEKERREQRRATAYEHRFAPGVEPGICDILQQTPQEKTWCDLEDEDCEK